MSINKINIMYTIKILPLIIVFSILISIESFSQHRGDNLSFQGFSFENESGVKALAMGGAYTSMSGDLSSLFWNPAGLADIKKIQFSISANYYSRNWRENQVYKPNRFFVTLPFYLEGLYVPDPKNNGVWDYQLAQDSSYFVNDPKLGQDPFSKEASDWQQSKENTLFNNIAVAVPFNLGEEKFVVSAAFTQKPLLDYDRNDTYLTPHPGYDYYGFVGRVDGLNEVVMKWSRFIRQKTGTLKDITAALAYNFSDNLKFGVGGQYIWGNTDDKMAIDRVGDFTLLRENRFSFTYSSYYQETTGQSKYDGLNLNVSGIFITEHFRVGARVDLPYTLKRKFSYADLVRDTVNTYANSYDGTDEMNLPASYSIGISIKPIDKFLISFDYKNAPFSKAEFKLASNDTTFRKWTDVGSICFGAEYRAFKFMSILAGYRTISQPFVPDGSAINENGPEAQSFNAGLSFDFSIGKIDLAYEIRRLKYYDSYYSNTDYNTQIYNNLLIAYTFSF